MNMRIYPKDKIKRLFEEYNSKHHHCPDCGSTSTKQTYMGFIMNVECPQSYKNKNKAMCNDCGWEGIVHDLVANGDTT